jgi:hypothetical protein
LLTDLLRTDLYARAGRHDAGHEPPSPPWWATSTVPSKRSGGLIYLHLDPGYEPLRSDPRYTELVSRIGLR